jgi:hypothetical protein
MESILELTFGNQQPMGSIGETQKEFYSKLAKELINNQYDYIGARKQHANAIDEHESIDSMFDTPVRSRFDAHLTSTKLKIRNSNNSRQVCYRVCGLKTTYHCSVCIDDPDIKDLGWLCHTKKGNDCFPKHMA